MTNDKLIEELEALADEWQQEADKAPHDMCAEKLKGVCAEELREVMDDYE